MLQQRTAHNSSSILMGLCPLNGKLLDRHGTPEEKNISGKKKNYYYYIRWKLLCVLYSRIDI